MFFDSGCVICKSASGPVCVGCESQLRAAPSLFVPSLDVCRAAYVLDDQSRPIIAALKYRRERRLARWLGQAASFLVPAAADVVTWVPATPARRQSRGFDQAEELAKSFARMVGVPVRSLVHRDALDLRQTGLGRSERLQGPRLRSSGPSDPFVVLVDDVITTGSSMRVAAELLRTAGAKRVVGVAVASTPLEREICPNALK